MDIKQLTYFMAVAQAGSFSQAAEHLGISQPALSISVKNLEEELGVKLLYAFGRRQMLTDEGRRLLEGAQQLMDVYQKTVEDVRRTDRNSSGAFSLGLPPLMGACFFGDLIPEFNRAYPNIRVHMIEEGAHRLDQMLQAGELDLALTLNTPAAPALRRCTSPPSAMWPWCTGIIPWPGSLSPLWQPSGRRSSPFSMRISSSTSRSWQPAGRRVLSPKWRF